MPKASSPRCSLPENWNYTLSGLRAINKEGKDAIRTSLRELEQAGYLRRSQTKAPNGRFSKNEYVIYELPQKPEPIPEEEPSFCPPESDPTLSSPPSSGKTPSENSTQIKIDQERIDQQKTNLIKFDSILSLEPKNEKRTDTIPIQELELYQEVIRENIAYDQLVAETPSDQPVLNEIVSLMTETICSRQATIRVAREHWPAGVVQSRLLKLDREHIRFVLDSMKENTTQIKNIRQYLLTALFHAPNTISSYYNARVNHDLAVGDFSGGFFAPKGGDACP